MSPSFRKALTYVIATTGYWSLALGVTAAGLLGDCLEPGCRRPSDDLAWVALSLSIGWFGYVFVIVAIRKFGR